MDPDGLTLVDNGDDTYTDPVTGTVYDADYSTDLPTIENATIVGTDGYLENSITALGLGTPAAAVTGSGAAVPSTTVASTLSQLGGLLSSVGKTVTSALVASNAGTPIYNSSGQIVGYTNAAGQVVSAAALNLQAYLPIILLAFGGFLIYKLLT